MLFVILLFLLIMLPSTVSVIRHLVWQQQEFASKLEFDLQNAVKWCRMWLVDFNTEKLRRLHLTSVITLVLFMWKWIGLSLRKNCVLWCWDWLYPLNLIGTLILSLLLKLPRRKLEHWLVLWSVFLLRLLCVFVNLSYCHAWNTVVISGLALLVATWSF